MNITDVKSVVVEGDRLVAIFNRQRELMDKYKPIERQNGLLETDAVPVDLHDRFGQARLKNFAWRMTEELAESVEVLLDPDSDGIYDDHFREEVADALHFFVELCILSGITPEDIVEKYLCLSPENLTGDRLAALFTHSIDVRGSGTGFINQAGRTVWELGAAMNCLKNKPWKVTHMLTDIPKYKNKVITAFWSFITALKQAKLGADEICDLYFRKSRVNEFRQESHY